MDLNQLCHASLDGDPTMQPPMQLALEANFGSVARWREGFVALVSNRDNNSGWLCLSFQPRAGTLVNRSYDDPKQALAAGVPILAMDASQHTAAIDAFVDSIAWAGVYSRYQAAVHAASETCAATADDIANAVVMDVRRAGAFEQASVMLPGAQWRDPAAVGVWAAGVPPDREVVVYCVYGHEVSRATALRLRAAGVNARYLSGGIDGWQAAGRPVSPKSTRQR